MIGVIVALFSALIVVGLLARPDPGLFSLQQQERLARPLMEQVADIDRALRFNHARFGTYELKTLTVTGQTGVMPRSAAEAAGLYSTGVRALNTMLAVPQSGMGTTGTTSLDADTPLVFASSARYPLPAGFGLTSCANAALSFALSAVCSGANSDRVLVIEFHDLHARPFAQTAGPAEYRDMSRHLAQRLAARYGRAAVDPSNAALIYVNLGLSS